MFVLFETNSPWDESSGDETSVHQILYRVFSRSQLRGAPDPGQAEKNSLEKVVELRTGTV